MAQVVLTKVKDEPEEEVIETDPVEVPPSVILEKLETLLGAGRVMLRFKRPDGWGINGKLIDQWCSFKADATGCNFVDDTAWCTDDAWADAEIEELKQLKERALKFPVTDAAQPTGFHARECRKTVFTFHKKRFMEARARAKAKAAKVSTAKSGAKAPTPTATTKVVAPPPQKSGKEAVTEVSSVDDEPVRLATTANGVSSFKKFLDAVKARFVTVKRLDKYREFLSAVKQGADNDTIVGLLGGHSDLILQFRRIPRGKTNGDKPSKPAPKVPKPPTQPPSQLTIARSESELQEVDVEDGEPEVPVVVPSEPVVSGPLAVTLPVPAANLVEDVLKSLEGDATEKFMRLVFGKSGARASSRLNVLRYLRSNASDEGSVRQMIILRGPPGVGKTTWAVQQLGVEIAVAGGNERVVRQVHVCSPDDFFTKHAFQESDSKEVFSYEPKDLESAHARNEARVTLLMELGMQPLYINSENIRLWEMSGYVKLAQKHGYEVSVTEPGEIFDSWNDAGELLERCTSNKDRPKTISKESLEGMLARYQTTPTDAVEGILGASRDPRPIASSEVPTPPAPAEPPAPAPGKRAAPPSFPPSAEARKAAKVAPKERAARPQATLKPTQPSVPPPRALHSPPASPAEIIDAEAEETESALDDGMDSMLHTSAGAPEALAASALLSSLSFFSK